MVDGKPRVSIGMPVFNGEKYLSQSIQSILAQTYIDFELIISDNASTDKTKEILHSYAAKDPRVKCYFNKQNIGGPKNYNHVFNLSVGEFFKWAAYDDVLAPTFLEKSIEVLDSDKSIVGCLCKTARINQNGDFLGYYNEGRLKNINSKKPHQRFRDLISLNYKPTPFHGLYRRDILAKSQLHGSYVGADRNLVAELGLLGRIYEIPRCLFYWREHPDSYSSMFYDTNKEGSLDSFLAQIAWWSEENGTYFTHAKNFVEYIKSVNRVPLARLERFLCYAEVLDWFMEEGYRFMAGDIIMFLMQHSKTARKLINGMPPSIKTFSPLKSSTSIKVDDIGFKIGV